MSIFRPSKLGEYLRVDHGFAFKGEHFSEHGRHIVLTPGNFYEQGGFKPRPGKDRYYQSTYPPRYLLKKNALIVAMTEQGEGLLGSSALVPTDDKYLHNQRIGLVREKAGVADTKFLYYLFNTSSVRQQIRNSSAGTKIRHTSPERMYGTDVIVPDLQTQQKIAAILSAYDDLIANNQRRITLLERMAEDIYREWFVRLRFPGHHQAKIEKGVPQGWTKRRFGDFCVLKRGYDLPDADIQDGVYPVIASTSIKAFHNQYKVEPPVITTGRSGSLGQVLFVNTKAWPLNTALYVRDFRGNSAYLVFYVLKNMELEKFNAGAGVPSLNRNHLSGVPIVVPPSHLQKAFDLQLEPLWVQKDLLTCQISKLTEMRDALLPRLISGKLAVDALDIRFPPSFEDAITPK
jgi:type I restriction enzyme, S subunit